MKINYFTFNFNLVCNAQQNFQKQFTLNTWFFGNKVLEIPGQGYFVIGVDDSLSVDSNGLRFYTLDIANRNNKTDSLL